MISSIFHTFKEFNPKVVSLTKVALYFQEVILVIQEFKGDDLPSESSLSLMISDVEYYSSSKSMDRFTF